MENTRRAASFDRSRDLKKPRLAVNGATNQVSVMAVPARYRDRVVQSVESSREEAYEPTNQMYEELVSQYKEALAELTVNSKPIITNLTIIAGENLHAAKAIAATVCGNILEVPTDQKLPSMYLLDSIVKNIGRDYIRYFASRLPEVFIRTYRQVDPSLHQSMRHLFGTWKAVFPPQTLQVIEKELGLAPAVNAAVNGASRAAAPRPDPRSQRPQHGIHVNPKVLERQRLQQSNKTIQQSHREPPVGTANKKSIGAPYEDYGYDSELPRNSGVAAGRTNGRINEHAHGKPPYEGGRGAPEKIFAERNNKSIVNEFRNYPVPKSADPDLHKLSAQDIASGSWKDTEEEEEFKWNSELIDHGAAGESKILFSQHSFPVLSPNQPGKPQKMQSGGLEAPPIQSRQHYSSSQPIQGIREPSSDRDPNPLRPPVSNLVISSTAEKSALNCLNSVAAKSPGQPSTSTTLLNAVTKGGNLQKALVSGGITNHDTNDIGKKLLHSGLQQSSRPNKSSTQMALSASVSCSASLDSTAVPARISQVNAEKPPLPPVPTPSTLVGDTSADAPTTGNTANPLSNLLSTLVLKGLISASKTEISTQPPDHLQKQGSGIASTMSEPVSSTPSLLAAPRSYTVDDASSSKQSGKSPIALPQSCTKDIRNLIGFQFKPQVIRKFHSSVINELFDDFQHGCTICGLMLKLKEQLDRHLKWHALKSSAADGSDSASRRWYANMAGWISGQASFLSALQSNSLKDNTDKSTENGEPMVPGDEDQCACVLCGEPFEDFYCQERDEWMFKGAVYMTNRSEVRKFEATNSTTVEGPIVHANCISESSLCDIDLITDIKIEDL